MMAEGFIEYHYYNLCLKLGIGEQLFGYKRTIVWV